MRNQDKVIKYFLELSNQYIKMNYYWFNRQEILQKAKENYSKEKAAEYYKQNKEAIKKNQDSVIKLVTRTKR